MKLPRLTEKHQVWMALALIAVVLIGVMIWAFARLEPPPEQVVEAPPQTVESPVVAWEFQQVPPGTTIPDEIPPVDVRWTEIPKDERYSGEMQSPDGKWRASRVDRPSGRGYDIAVLDAASGAEAMRYGHVALAHNVATVGWSPDSRYYVEQGWVGEVDGPVLAILDTVERSIREMPVDLGSPDVPLATWVWKPDASGFVGSVQLDTQDWTRATYRLYDLDLDTGRTSTISEFEFLPYSYPRWSPDMALLTLSPPFSSDNGGPMAVVAADSGRIVYPRDTSLIMSQDYENYRLGSDLRWLVRGCWGHEPGIVYAWRAKARPEWDGTIWRVNALKRSERMIADMRAYLNENDWRSAWMAMRPGHNEVGLSTGGLTWSREDYNTHALLFDPRTGKLRYLCEGRIEGWSADGSRVRVQLSADTQGHRTGWLEIAN